MSNNNTRMHYDVNMPEQKEAEIAAPVTHDIGGAVDFNKLQSQKNMMPSQQLQQQPLQQQSFSSMPQQSFPSMPQQTLSDKNKPMMMNKNDLVQLEPELKQEIVNHPPLHHATIVNDHSAPVLTTPTDSQLSSSSSSGPSVASQIQMMAGSAVARANQIASNIKQGVSDKINEMKENTSTPRSSPAHYIPSDLKEEIIHHPTLHHTDIIKDHSAPVLNVPTDHNISKQSTATLGDLKDIAVAKTAPIAASLSLAATSAAASVSAAASNLKQAASDKIIQMKKEQEAMNAPHYISANLKQEIIRHPALHHTQIVKDHSAPVLSVPTDHNIAPQPSTMAQLHDLKDIAVAKTAPLVASVSSVASSAAASVSAAASNLKQAASEKIQEMKKDQIASSTPHYIQPALKEELVHHPPLHHVTDISKDHSAPMLSAPTDSIRGPMIASSSSSSSSSSSVASSIAATLSHAGSVISHTAEQIAAKASDLGHNIQDKAAEVYHSISSPTAASSMKQTSPKRETVRHPVPQHPDVVLHPGPVKLTHVHSTLPEDKSSNLLAKHPLDAKEVNVHNGGIAWSLPLDTSSSSSSSSSSLPSSSMMSSQQPQTVSSISSTPSSVTYSTLSSTPSSVTYTQTTKSVETIPLSNLNRKL